MEKLAELRDESGLAEVVEGIVNHGGGAAVLVLETPHDPVWRLYEVGSVQLQAQPPLEHGAIATVHHGGNRVSLHAVRHH